MARVYETNFDSETVGQLPTGWANRTGTSWLVGTTTPVSSPNSFSSETAGDFCDYVNASVLLADCEVGYSFVKPAINYLPKGLAVRMNGADFTTGYLVLPTGTYNNSTDVGTINLFYRNGSAFSAITSGPITVAGSPVTGDIIDVSVSIIGTTILARMWKRGTTKPNSGTGTYTWTDSRVTAAGYPGSYASAGVTMDDFWVDNLVSSSYTVTGPSSGAVGVASSDFTIAVTGTIASTVFTPSDSGGGGTFTPTSRTLSGTDPTSTFTYTPASSGAKSITVANNGGLTQPSAVTYTASIAGTNIPVNNSNLLWSPASWDDVAIGTYGVSVRSMQAATSGAYLSFNVANCTDVTLLIDTTISTTGNTYKPSIWYSVDGGAIQKVQIIAQTSLALLTGGASGNHSFRINLVEVPYAGQFSEVAGTSLLNGLRLQGIVINTGASMASPAAKSKKLVFYGDSITEGVKAGAGAINDPLSSSVPAVANAVNADYGQTGFGSQGYQSAGIGAPAFPTTWDRFSTDRLKTLTGIDYIFNMHGTNGTTTASDVSTWMTNARTGFGAATIIFIVIPPGGYNATAITNGFNDYVSADPADENVYLIDMRTNVDVSYFNGTGANAYSSDGIHPNAAGNVLISDEIIRQIDQILNVTYTVTYTGTDSTSGSAPSDPQSPFAEGSTVSVLGFGTLVRTGYNQSGWTDGTETYIENDTFVITENKTLEPVWVEIVSVSFSSLTANGTSEIVTTTALALTFDIDPVGLVAGNITVLGATKGVLSWSGITRSLTISEISVSNGKPITVQVSSPAGYAITPTSRTVNVSVAKAPPGGGSAGSRSSRGAWAYNPPVPKKKKLGRPRNKLIEFE